VYHLVSSWPRGVPDNHDLQRSYVPDNHDLQRSYVPVNPNLRRNSHIF